jgi:hypothetical protein
MAADRQYAVEWLIRRIEWERTLADLHARSRRGAVPASAAVESPVNSTLAPPGPRPVRALRCWFTRNRPSPSPVRGMSEGAIALKIRR